MNETCNLDIPPYTTTRLYPKTWYFVLTRTIRHREQGRCIQLHRTTHLTHCCGTLYYYTILSLSDQNKFLKILFNCERNVDVYVYEIARHGFAFLARLHEVHRAIAVTPVVHVPVPVRVTLALKFSRSPYIDNHSSERIHTWTIDTPVGLAFIPWHRAPGSRPGGGAGG